MPRAPLAAISGNRQKHQELTPYLRAKIEGAYQTGASISTIKTTFEISRQTAEYTIKLTSDRKDAQSLPRSGTPRVYDDRDTRAIMRYVRINPKSTYQEMMDTLKILMSKTTYYRILRDAGISNWRCKKRPFLTEEHARNRLAWVSERIDWSEEWHSIIFSDECSLERGSGKRGKWCWRTPQQKWSRDFVDPQKTGKDISVMIWGAIWLGGRSEIIFMERDDEAPRGGYSANSYLAVLNEEIPRIWSPGMIFMQDGARIHTAQKIKNWFIDHAIPTLP
jgi:DDE superfamily endonuclease/Transposase